MKKNLMKLHQKGFLKADRCLIMYCVFDND